MDQIYRNKVLEELRQDIKKVWEGTPSTLSVQDIIAAKTKLCLIVSVS